MMQHSKRLGLAPLYLLAACVMAYGWGYRGIVGHEGGAMVPGAMKPHQPNTSTPGSPASVKVGNALKVAAKVVDRAAVAAAPAASRRRSAKC